MPTLDLKGIGSVQVGDDFKSLSPEDQEKTVNEIALHLGGQKPPQDSSFSRAYTGMHEEGKRTLGEVAGYAAENLKGAFTDVEHPPGEGFLTGYGRELAATPGKVGQFFKGVGQATAVPFAYPIGAAASLTGRPLAQLIHKTGEIIAPQTAAQHTPEDVYQQIRPDVMTALSTTMPKGAATPLPKAPPGAEPPMMGPPPKVAAPTRDELFNTARSLYDESKTLDVYMKPQSTSTLSNNIRQTLDAEGFRDYLTPKTYRALEELKNTRKKMEFTDEETGATSKEPVSTLGDVEGVRRALNKAAMDPQERGAASIAIDKLNTYFGNLGKERPAIMGPDAARASSVLEEARGNYAAGKRSEAIDKAGYIAELNADSAGSGANIDNATRQAVKSVLRNPEKLRGFSEDEISQMRKVVAGTFTGNTSRLFGKLAPKDIVSAAASGGAGYAAAGSAGVPALWGVGFAAKKLGDFMTKTQFNKLDQMVRSRSPLGEQMAAPLKKWVEAGQQFSTSPTMPAYIKFQIAGTNLANNLKDIGIRINPADLIRTLQGPVPAPAETEQK